MKVKVLFFGYLQEKTGCAEWNTEASDTASLLTAIQNTFSISPDFPLSIAVNQDLIHGNTPLQVGDEIALMPPFAGG